MIGALRNSRFGYRVVPLLLTAALLVGCATAIPADATPAQRRMIEAGNRFNNTVVEGAVVGLVGGALLGALTGNWKGAAIGAVAGAATGGAAGYLVAQNNYQTSRTVDNLNVAIQDASKASQEARADAVASQQVADEARAKAASLADAVRAHTITADQYQAQLASYNGTLEAMRKVSQGYTDKASSIRASARLAGGNGSQMSNAANDIDRSRSAINRAIEQLRQATARPAA